VSAGRGLADPHDTGAEFHAFHNPERDCVCGEVVAVGLGYCVSGILPPIFASRPYMKREVIWSICRKAKVTKACQVF
jgi:hypothetical protein